ncbi:MAG: hypothetical protein KAW12_16890 [Candidatus Aminicenantes bacterium]|nr:hypothetical protein [Candidatus Aminicenantes bacterium]
MKWVKAIIKDTEVSIAFDENSIHIYNAYTIKDDLKLRGYRWEPADKSWHTSPGDVESEIDVLQNNLSRVDPAPMPRPAGGEAAKFPASCSVVELRSRIDRLIREGLRGQIWVRGVIASQVKNYQWFSYFDLKDEDEQQDIYFNVEVKKNDLERVTGKLRDLGAADALEKDLPVFSLVEVHLSFRNAVDIRLRLLDILPEYTQAKIRNRREITLDKLKEEGVLEKQKRLALPGLVSRVGLITSQQGTSVSDITAGLGAFAGKYSFYFVDTRMEGANAVDSLVRAIDYLEFSAGFPLDAVIIARGGGSEQSLAVFNDYRLCRRVCDCSIPMLTAIGHEKDLAAIEMCSFLTPTPATPSGIGKYLHDRFFDLQLSLSASVQRLIEYFSNIHNREIEKIRGYVKNIPNYAQSFLQLREDRFFALVRRLEQSVSFTVRDQERRIENLLMQALVKEKSYHEAGKKSLRQLVASILARAAAQRGREVKQIEKTILKIDFAKRVRVNREQVRDIRHIGRDILRRTGRTVLEKEKTLQSLADLIKASDPENILKKGFTLTLDGEDRVIKSLVEFGKTGAGRLRFHDGIVKIKKQEEA